MNTYEKTSSREIKIVKILKAEILMQIQNRMHQTKPHSPNLDSTKDSRENRPTKKIFSVVGTLRQKKSTSSWSFLATTGIRITTDTCFLSMLRSEKSSSKMSSRWGRRSSNKSSKDQGKFCRNLRIISERIYKSSSLLNRHFRQDFRALDLQSPQLRNPQKVWQLVQKLPSLAA